MAARVGLMIVLALVAICFVSETLAGKNNKEKVLCRVDKGDETVYSSTCVSDNLECVSEDSGHKKEFYCEAKSCGSDADCDGTTCDDGKCDVTQEEIIRYTACVVDGEAKDRECRNGCNTDKLCKVTIDDVDHELALCKGQKCPKRRNSNSNNGGDSSEESNSSSTDDSDGNSNGNSNGNSEESNSSSSDGSEGNSNGSSNGNSEESNSNSTDDSNGNSNGSTSEDTGED